MYDFQNVKTFAWQETPETSLAPKSTPSWTR